MIKLAVFKFASCDGCQLSLLDCEDELLQLADKVEILQFLEATSEIKPGPYDVALVEGSITTPDDIDRIKTLRKDAKWVVTLGACANSGGVQALKNFSDHKAFIDIVYAHPEYIQTLEDSQPISHYVKVDFELQGCPINKNQLLNVLKGLIYGTKMNISNDSVCVSCKRKGNVCVMVASGEACLGPITHAGCGALCPTYQRGCYGCYGPNGLADANALTKQLEEKGHSKAAIQRIYQTFNANAKVFREQGEQHD